MKSESLCRLCLLGSNRRQRVLAPLRKIPHAAIPENEFPGLPNLECNSLTGADT